MYQVAIISCGMIANCAHIPAYRRFADQCEIVAVCDKNETAAKETAERHHIPRYFTDAEEMLRVCRPDIVSVCTAEWPAQKVCHGSAGSRSACSGGKTGGAVLCRCRGNV